MRLVIGLSLVCVVGSSMGAARGLTPSPSPSPSPAPASAPDASASAADSAPRVDWSHGIRAQRWVKTWLRNGAVPEAVEEHAWVTGLSAVRLTLRRGGQTLGRGQVVRDDLPSLVAKATAADASDPPDHAEAPPVDLRAMVRRAAAHAVDQLAVSLRDARMRAALDPNIHDPGKLPAIADIAHRIQVDVQLAGPMHPIRINRGAPPSAVFHRFAPGFHGLRLTNPPAPGDRGPRPGALMWPASALAANTAPASQIIQLLHAQGDSPEAMEHVARPGGPRLQRFDVIHVTRPQPDMKPMALVRGNEVLPIQAMNRKTIEAMAQGLAGHLRSNLLQDGRMRGTYQPSKNTYHPAFASSAERALACYALTRHARFALHHPPDTPQVKVLARRAMQSAGDLGETLTSNGSDSPPKSPSAAALVLLTLVDSPAPGADHGLRDRLARELMAMHRPGRGYAGEATPPTGDREGPGAKTRTGKAKAMGISQTRPSARAGGDRAPAAPPRRGVNQATAALVTAALAAYHQQTGDAASAKVVRDVMHTLWSSTHASPNIAALPWFLLARQRMARAGQITAGASSTEPSPEQAPAASSGSGESDPSTGPPEAEATANADGPPIRSYDAGINRLVARLLAQQVIEPPVLGPRDVIGGFELRAAPPGSPPNPDWRTAQMLDFLALAIRDRELTPQGQGLGRLLSAGLAARFLGQLMMDRESCFYISNTTDTLHGVRLSLWDNRMAVGPNSVTLLALTDLRQALASLRQRRNQAPPTPPAQPQSP